MHSPILTLRAIKIFVVIALFAFFQSEASADVPSNELVNFPDANLEAAIRDALNKPSGDITSSDLLTLTQFEALNQQIEDITGLEYATNLITLNLSLNQIPQLTPLTQLTKLQELDLGGNRALQNLDFLRSLHDLSYLNLSSNGLYLSTPLNLDVISDLSQLTHLILRAFRISDLTPLKNLTNLVELDLRGTPSILDLTPLQELTNLATLNLENVTIEDFSPLKSLVSLNSLKLYFLYASNQVELLNSLTEAIKTLPALETLEVRALKTEGISQIASAIPNIKNLHIYSSEISDISALSSLTNLSTLSLEDNQITDISSLANLTNLTSLNIDDNRIQDISPLANLTNLTSLSFGMSQYYYSTDISPLSNLTNLSSLSFTNANDIAPILNLSGLTSLSIGYSKVPSLDLLTNLQNLKSLSIRYSSLRDISALSQLPQLESLSLNYNSISDISAIVTQKKLISLYLSYNYISDLTPVFQLDQLRSLLIIRNLIQLDPGMPQRVAYDAYIESRPQPSSNSPFNLNQNSISSDPINKTVTSANNNYTVESFITPIWVPSYPTTEDIPDPVFVNENNWISINLLDQSLWMNARGQFFGYQYAFSIEVEENNSNEPRSATFYIFGEPHTVTQNGKSTPVIFQDPNLISALREILNKPNGDILDQDMVALTSLDLSNRGIIDLSGLEAASNLSALDLSSNKIVELEPLSLLPKLTDLNLFENKIDDIKPIAGLSKIQNLDISYNQIEYSSYNTKTYLTALELIDGIQIIKFPLDSDSDGLYDFIESRIIDADLNDNFEDLSDVIKTDDFDHDGFSNYSEQNNQSDPTDFASPSSSKILQTALIPILENNQIKLRLEIKEAPAGQYRLGFANDLKAKFKGVEITPDTFTYQNPTQQTISFNLDGLDYSNGLFLIVR